MRSWILSIYLVASAPACGQPLDCETLLHGSEPFQLEMSNSDGRLFRLQVLRGAGLQQLQYAEQPDGKVARKTFEATFVKSARRRDGRIVDATWSVPTARYFWEEGIATAEYRFSDETDRHVATFTMLGEATERVGPCRVGVKHYSAVVRHPNVLIKSEVWYSIDLRVPVRSIDVSEANGTTHLISSRTEDVSLNFEAMR